MCQLTIIYVHGRHKNGTTKAVPLYERNYERTMTHDGDECAQSTQHQRDNIRAPTTTATLHVNSVTAQGGETEISPHHRNSQRKWVWIQVHAQQRMETSARMPYK